MYAPTENKLASVYLDSDSIFDHIKEHIRTHPDKAKSFNAVVLFKITKNGQVVKNWCLDLQDANVYVGEPNSGEPDTTVTISDEDFLGVMSTKLNPQQGLMEGKIKVTGNSMHLHKIWILLRITAGSKL